MCLGKMRNLAPACINGLSTAYLSESIWAVSAQWAEQEHKYRIWIHLWTQHTPPYAAQISLIQLLMFEVVWSEYIYMNVCI